jgi:GTPase SAR1 family protein
MGSGLTKSANPSVEDLHAKKVIGRKLDAELEKDSRQEEEKIKLLLLGAGESGKSTIFKQMKIIYGTKFSEAERRIHASTIHSNIILAMKVLIRHCLLRGSMDDFPPEIREHIEKINAANENNAIDSALADSITEVWNNHTMQATWEKRHEYQIIESLRYYMSRMEDIRKADYIPTHDDILYNRVRTSGIVTERYVIDRAIFEMYDVGGQRNERKKWIHCFEGVTAIIFVVALSEFDQLLYEDDKTNRMVNLLINPFCNVYILIFFLYCELF